MEEQKIERPSLPDLEYRILPLEKVQVRSIDPKNRTRCRVTMRGRGYETTERFWTSFFSRFGFSDSVFKYFGHQEVFDRICKLQPEAQLRFCVNRDNGTVLAVSSPNKPVVSPAQLTELVTDYGGRKISYGNGVIRSEHSPESGRRGTDIGPDKFYNRFVLETPVDGYGHPSTYLALWREVCENGAVAMTPAFRSDIAKGDDPIYSIRRALDTFDSDEGFSALRQRFQAAQGSPASLWECLRLFKALRDVKDKDVVRAYDRVVGDVHNEYGVANLDGISSKKLRLLPAKCRVYDLINLASEVATHRVSEETSMRLQAWIGTTVSDEYDLEGTLEKGADFEGRFMPPKRRAPRGGSPN